MMFRLDGVRVATGIQRRNGEDGTDRFADPEGVISLDANSNYGSSNGRNRII